MTLYWLNTNSPKVLNRRINREVIDHLISNTIIDAALLAEDLGLNEHTVLSYQRQLGLRRIFSHD